MAKESPTINVGFSFCCGLLDVLTKSLLQPLTAPKLAHTLELSEVCCEFQ
jgi:hypothetical protein